MLIWVIRLVIGLVVFVTGTYLLGIDTSVIPWWKAILGFAGIFWGVSIIPDYLPTRVRDKRSVTTAK